MKFNIKTILLLSVCIIGCSKAESGPPPGYKLVWSDEFNDSTLDAAKWTSLVGPRELGYNSNEAVAVNDGSFKAKVYSQNNQTYVSYTKSKFESIFGYYEAKIKFNGAPGIQCAFWLQSNNIGKYIGDNGKNGMEIDIVEHRMIDSKKNPIDNLLATNIHWDGYKENHKTAGNIWKSPFSLNNSWHLYSLLWDKDGYNFYLDDKFIWHTDKALSQSPEFIILSCESKNDSWAGEKLDEYKPSLNYGFEADWVRVYQNNN